MARILDSAAPGFGAAFKAALASRGAAAADIGATVAAIIEAVRCGGDSAVIDHTARFDRIAVTAGELRFADAEIATARAACTAESLAALDLAATRIEAFHRRQMPADIRYTDEVGVELGVRWRPIAAAGIYVPGGLAAYPSSVLMNALPARVAGVERVAMAVPTPDGAINPLVLAAAAIAGVDEIYRIGGAQAIAALAHGTETIAPVDKVVGPGNVYVAEAKRQLFGIVGIDMIAGPSEILVVADADNDPRWIAADLLSQAEHDRSAQAILITDDGDFADAVAAAVDHELERLDRAEIAAASWRDYGMIITVGDWAEAPALIDAVAPEHLELAVADPEAIADAVRHAGAIFMGRHTPEAIGDYVAGPNHVLPTAGSARFSSGLSVLDFSKRTSLVRCDASSLGAIGPAAMTLAACEGLGAHALSIGVRLNRR
ncbi:MAG: histidinol dehydrogenase [Alphaproteobacteria bacterium]|nr:histidinol dehydrogenase [Alphaproteobacteria bacterium]MDP6517646.1 histidinol dehydrogenase [Alphaproteobacteria bacterium]